MTNKLTVFFKMMVLYMLGRVDFDLTATQIGEFMVIGDYMSFFSFQQLLYDLEQDGFVTTSKQNHNTYYHLEDEGRRSLEYFGSNLQSDIRGEIDEYVRSRSWEMRESSSIRTDYTLNSNREYSVRLQALEHNLPLIDLTITVPDEETARRVCGRWSDRNGEVYRYITEKLL